MQLSAWHAADTWWKKKTLIILALPVHSRLDVTGMKQLYHLDQVKLYHLGVITFGNCCFLQQTAALS